MVKYVLGLIMVALLSISTTTSADARRGHGYRHYGGKHYGRHYRPHYRNYRRHYSPRRYYNYRPRRYYNYIPYVGIPFVYGRPYNGGCAWIKSRAARTGSQHWWRKYYNCMDYYGH